MYLMWSTYEPFDSESDVELSTNDGGMVLRTIK